VKSSLDIMEEESRYSSAPNVIGAGSCPNVVSEIQGIQGSSTPGLAKFLGALLVD